MKPRLQTSLGQHLVLTPQLRQALHLLQLSMPELELEITEAVESNPLLEWEEPSALSASDGESGPDGDDPRGERDDDAGHDAWDDDRDVAWGESQGGSGGGGDDQDGDASERIAQSETLRDHLTWQLNLSHLSPRELAIGEALVDAIDDDGYLREPLSAIAEALAPELRCSEGEIAAALRTVQRLDPTGVGARDLGECLLLQLDALPDDTPGRDLARRAVATLIERLARLGIEGVADALGCSGEEANTALQLIKSLEPRPGAGIGGMPHDTYVVPDCSISRQNGVWRVTLAGSRHSRLTIHRGYEQMLQHTSGADAGYLRGRLQEARWLLKNLEARGETLLKVVRCLVREQSGFLEFGAQALRPLTLREVAAQIGMHESTVSRAVSRKYVHTPRGTIPLRAFFASGIDTGGGGEASSIAIQDMIRRLVEAEDPRKPLSDARLADRLKDSGIPVARRTVAKYREALNIPSSHERVRMA
ncbi:RNA polymerase factor sigma-54 [Luteimonas terricola]|uniref:RNA polymerase sigma-54 factor n=1 Tax=Luteimonas terricola TaxID=645597 RepID=A0ABQ2EH85_9GAMM|nr:RNA polymerase factor sigma-54 [Luteimonas terricola]GGK12041.1 RNA polymerase sigma-54 factor [Luteimonas terricola]